MFKSNEPARAVIDGRDSWVFPDGRVLPVIFGGDDSATVDEARTLVDLQRAQRAEIVQAATDAIALAETEERALTAEETEIVTRAAVESEQIDATIASTVQIVRGNDLATVDLRTVTPAVTSGGVVVRSEPQTYTKHGAESYFRDLALATLARQGARSEKYRPETDERLTRHAREVEVESRAGSTSDTAGGDFVPPMWILSEYAPLFRAGRATADLARALPLPAGTDSINLPTVTTGTLTAIQATENTAATTRDMMTGSTTADVTTVAGYYDVSLQLLEQSALAGGWDALVYQDLIKDRNRATDVFVLNGSGTSNTPLGIVTAAFTSVTVSTAAATAIYSGLGDALSRIASNRFDMPEVIIMHPRRWFWLASRFDTSGRPLVLPDGPGAQNLLAQMGILNAQGAVGTMMGLPVVIDPNVSITTSTYFDDIIVWKASDSILMEGAPKLESFRDILSASLGVRFRLYNYAAFTPRTSKAVAYLTGAGLTGPTF